jgi:hypothetical protein
MEPEDRLMGKGALLCFHLMDFAKNSYDVIYLKDISYDFTHIQLAICHKIYGKNIWLRERRLWNPSLTVAHVFFCSLSQH